MFLFLDITSFRRLSPGAIAAVAVVVTVGGVAATACIFPWNHCVHLKYAKKVKILYKVMSTVHKMAKEVKCGSDDNDDDNDE